MTPCRCGHRPTLVLENALCHYACWACGIRANQDETAREALKMWEQMDHRIPVFQCQCGVFDAGYHGHYGGIRLNYPDRHYCGGSWEAIWPHDPRYRDALECARGGPKKIKGNECVVVEYEIKHLPHETGDNKLKAIPVRKNKPAVDGNESVTPGKCRMCGSPGRVWGLDAAYWGGCSDERCDCCGPIKYSEVDAIVAWNELMAPVAPPAPQKFTVTMIAGVGHDLYALRSDGKIFRLMYDKGNGWYQVAAVPGTGEP